MSRVKAQYEVMRTYLSKVEGKALLRSSKNIVGRQLCWLCANLHRYKISIDKINDNAFNYICNLLIFNDLFLIF